MNIKLIQQCIDQHDFKFTPKNISSHQKNENPLKLNFLPFPNLFLHFYFPLKNQREIKVKEKIWAGKKIQFQWVLIYLM